MVAGSRGMGAAVERTHGQPILRAGRLSSDKVIETKNIHLLTTHKYKPIQNTSITYNQRECGTYTSYPVSDIVKLSDIKNNI